jgi:hypothetical protein
MTGYLSCLAVRTSIVFDIFLGLSTKYNRINAEMYAQKKWWRGGREIAAFEEGPEFLGQDPDKFYKPCIKVTGAKRHLTVMIEIW